MKTRRILISLLLAALFVLSMAATALAANDGTITVTNPTAGYDYTLYKVFDLTYNDSGDVAYTYDGSNAGFLAALQDDSSPFTLTGPFTLADSSVSYVVTLKDNMDADAISSFLTAQKANLQMITEKTAAESDDSVVFSGLAYGYYYITSTLGSVVTIDSTTPNVTVVDKNQAPDWNDQGKTIVDAEGNETVVSTANYGDTVNFKIAVDATAYNGDKKITNYYIMDTLSAGFSEATITAVKVDDTVLTAGTGYLITKQEDDADGNHVLEINIPYDSDAYGANATIEVTYSAVVQNTAVLAGLDGNTNNANYTWIEAPGPDDPPPTPEYPDENKKTTSTYVYALGILKVDPEGNALDGAEFTVKDSEGNTIYATGSDGVYEYCASTATGALSQFATDENGLLIIKGVAAGEYEITEAVAPNGYNLLPAPETITATLQEAYETTITYYLDANGNVTDEVTTTEKTVDVEDYNISGMVIVNIAGTELPSTGGSGIYYFYVIGGILLIGAGVLLFTRKIARRAK